MSLARAALSIGAPRSRPFSSSGMDDLEIRQAPAFMAHVLCHDSEPLGFDLAFAPDRVRLADVAALDPVAVGGEDQSLAMQIGADQKDRAAYCVQPDRNARAAEGVHRAAALVAPSVEIEGRAARNPHAMWM